MDLQEQVTEERTPLGNNGFRKMSGLTGYREALYLDNGFTIVEEDCCHLPRENKLMIPVFAGTVTPTSGSLKECLECSDCRKSVLAFNARCASTFKSLGPNFAVIVGISPITFEAFKFWMLATRKWPCKGCEHACNEVLKQMVEMIEAVPFDRAKAEFLAFIKVFGDISTAQNTN